MSGAVALSALRAQVRKRADVEGATSRHTDAEVNSYVNKSWNELYDLIAGSNEDYYTSTGTLNFGGVNGAVQALPAGFHWLRTATLSYNGWAYELERVNMSEIDSWSNFGGSYAGSPFGYVLIGDNMQLVPDPGASTYVVTIRYVPLPTDMTTDVDTIPGQAGYEEFVVWRAAAMILAIDGRDPTIAQAEAERQKARILDAVQRRNIHQPKSILRRTPSIHWRKRRVV